MRPQTIARVLTLALLVAGTSILAAPEQTATPGQMTQARVWVQNHSRSEAVPVDLRDVNLDTPLRVQVINGEPQYTQSAPVQIREIRRIWEYETLTVQPKEDMAVRLTARGASGWETTGIWSVNADGVATVVLKRAR